MRRMKRGLRIYVLSVITGGAVTLGAALVLFPPALSTHHLVLATLLVSVSGITYLSPVKLASHRAVIFDTAVHTVAIVTLAPAEAAALMALSAAIGHGFFGRRAWYSWAFNAAQIGLSVLAAGAVYAALRASSTAAPVYDGRLLAALAPAALTLYVVGAALVDGAAALQRGWLPWATWWNVHSRELASHAALVALGAAAAGAIAREPWLVLVAATPVGVAPLLVRATMRFDDGLVRIAEEMADALEARRPDLRGRSRTMADLADRLARARAFSDIERRRVTLAARLHDLASHGLTDTAPVHGRGHAEAMDQSAAFVGQALGLPSVAEILHHHHECYDGSGRPRGVAGMDIPLESRMVALCEAWTTLTLGSAGQPAVTPRQAAVMIRAGSGAQWDPALVTTLCALTAPEAPETSPQPAGNARPAPA